MEADDSLCVSVSHTTRNMRPGEVDGENYHFVDKDTFLYMVEQGEFLEHASVFGRHYGTSKSEVDSLLASGDDVILEIDWQGAAQIRQQHTDAVSIFILPPSEEELKKRLKGRGQDDEATIATRMAEAKNESSHYNEADYIVINDDFDQALSDLRSIVNSYRLRLAAQQAKHADLLHQLLS